MVKHTSELEELALRCEQATGPDRELDIKIVVAIDWLEPEWEEGERTAREMAEKHGIEWLTSRSVEGFSSIWRHLPRFTASLDAAMTLVPEGCVFMVTNTGIEDNRTADLTRATALVGPPDDVTVDYVSAATPALALCAAALRALRNQGDTNA